MAAVFAPGDRFRGVDAQGTQPLGVFVGAARLAAAEEGVDHGPQRVGALKTLDGQLVSVCFECLDRVASFMERLSAAVEGSGKPFRECPQGLRSGIEVNAHGSGSFPAKVSLSRRSRKTFSGAMLADWTENDLLSHI